jgi:hypothetical protein
MGEIKNRKTKLEREKPGEEKRGEEAIGTRERERRGARK